ncbi:MAG TPA: 2-C-methyl-D-erythritol 4-phosphate cytidylyltransferase [Ktedonobacterales bacterium]|nr:2-C-methyl-D-erythritol 4-phosphate cytidylyltransferase [Ktedonobacterales bacterium]
MRTDGRTHGLAGAIVLASHHPAPELLWESVAGRPLLAWSVAACEKTPEIAETLLIVPKERLAEAQLLAESQGWARVRVLPGGERPRESIEAGLRALGPALAWVVIHEAARPLVTHALLRAALDLAQQTGADVITGGPVKETVKRLRDGLVVETLPRERMARAQTPYVFSRERLLAAHVSLPHEQDFPDEATLALAAGLPLRVIPGPPDNIQVTSVADLAVIAALVARRAS